MELEAIARRIDAPAAQAFVRAARHVIDALLIEGARVSQARTPQPRPYAGGDALARSAPPGGWLTHSELQEQTRRLAEAIASERWVDGLTVALRILTRLGV